MKGISCAKTQPGTDDPIHLVTSISSHRSPVTRSIWQGIDHFWHALFLIHLFKSTLLFLKNQNTDLNKPWYRNPYVLSFNEVAVALAMFCWLQVKWKIFKNKNQNGPESQVFNVKYWYVFKMYDGIFKHTQKPNSSWQRTNWISRRAVELILEIKLKFTWLKKILRYLHLLVRS